MSKRGSRNNNCDFCKCHTLVAYCTSSLCLHLASFCALVQDQAACRSTPCTLVQFSIELLYQQCPINNGTTAKRRAQDRGPLPQQLMTMSPDWRTTSSHRHLLLRMSIRLRIGRQQRRSASRMRMALRESIAFQMTCRLALEGQAHHPTLTTGSSLCVISSPKRAGSAQKTMKIHFRPLIHHQPPKRRPTTRRQDRRGSCIRATVHS